MDIRKITVYIAEFMAGCIVGLIFFGFQMGIWLLTLQVTGWRWFCFLIHFINGMCILGFIALVVRTLSHRRKKPRGIIADLTILAWMAGTLWYVWR